ncbi:MAG: hypothetical protein J6P21_04050 [Clostridia bacterium]|nr:hypothetical protein [Clostridia bacterium]
MSVSNFSKFCACVLGLNFMLPFCNFPKVDAGQTFSSSLREWEEGPFICSLNNTGVLEVKLSEETPCATSTQIIDGGVQTLKSLDVDLFNGKRLNWKDDVKKIVIGDGIQWIGDSQFGFYKGDN